MKIGIKECFNWENKITHLGLKEPTLKFIPSKNSTVVELLKNQDLISNYCTPFCTGILDYETIHKDGTVAGASSSGTALAVEEDLIEVGVCTDTGGSTIVPASRLNCYGFKPSFGRISRFGLVPLCSCLDTVSLMSKNFESLMEVFKKIDVPDEKDSLCLKKRVQKKLEPNIYIVSNLFEPQDLMEIEKLFPLAKKIEIPLRSQVLLGYYYYLMCPDFYSNLARFDGVHHKGQDSFIIANYDVTQIKNNRSSALNLEIKSRIVTGAKLLENYSYKICKEIFSYSRKIIDYPGIIVLPVSEPNKLNVYTYIANLSHRPSVTIPNKTKNGFFLCSNFNTDIQLLDYVKKNLI